MTGHPPPDARPKTSLAGPVLIGLAAMAGVLLAGGVWAGTTRLDRAVIAGAQAAAKPRPTSVETDRMAPIVEVHVAEGQSVAAGDPLVSLDTSAIEAELGGERRRIAALRIRLARLEAEGRGLDQFDLPPGTAAEADVQQEFARSERAILAARITGDRSATAVLAAESAAMRQQARSIAAEIAQLEALSATYVEEADRLRPLADRGVVRSGEITALDRRRMEVGAQVQSLRTREADAAGRSALATLRIGQITSERQRIVTEERNAAQHELLAAEQRVAALELALSRSVLRAPHGGQVFRLAVEGRGEVATPGQPLLLIVPEDARLVASGRLAIEDIKDLAVGDTARIQLVSYADSGHLMLEGAIERLSPQAIADPATGSTFFEIEVAIDPDRYRALTGRLPLPGEPMQLLVTVQEETLLETLLSPITARLPTLFPI